jgi:NAD+ synthase
MNLVTQIADWMRYQVNCAGASGLVVGLSGGVDSACVAGLAQHAVGSDGILGVLLPCHSDPVDGEFARQVAEVFGLDTITVDLTPVFDSFVAALPPSSSRMAKANIKPRLRMTSLYYVANSRNALVVGTGNKSERMIGYFTKYGDGGSDLLPLGDLYKREVYDLAREIGVPQPIIERPPTAGLWPGQTDEEEMGITYDALERALAALTAGDGRSADESSLRRVREMVDASAHKRALPPIFRHHRD